MSVPSVFVPPHIVGLVKSIQYKPGWTFSIAETEGCPVLKFFVYSFTEDSLNKGEHISVRHEFMVPPATYNRDTWAAWLFDRIRDVETHEAGEFFQIDGVREFAPHHSNGEDPYRVYHVGDWSTANKSSGED